MNGRIKEFQSAKGKIEECLLHRGNFVSNSVSSSFEGSKVDWEASILPLSYTRPNHIYFSPKAMPVKKVPA